MRYLDNVGVRIFLIRVSGGNEGHRRCRGPPTLRPDSGGGSAGCGALVRRGPRLCSRGVHQPVIEVRPPWDVELLPCSTHHVAQDFEFNLGNPHCLQGFVDTRYQMHIAYLWIRLDETFNNFRPLFLEVLGQTRNVVHGLQAEVLTASIDFAIEGLISHRIIPQDLAHLSKRSSVSGLIRFNEDLCNDLSTALRTHYTNVACQD